MNIFYGRLIREIIGRTKYITRVVDQPKLQANMYKGRKIIKKKKKKEIGGEGKIIT